MGYNSLFRSETIKFGLQVFAHKGGFLRLLGYYSMSLCIFIVPHTGYHPAYLYIRFIGFDAEFVARNLLRNYSLRKLSHTGKLITEIYIQGLEITWQSYRGVACSIGSNITIINIHHVGAFH